MLCVSLCRGHALRQPSERSVWRLRTIGTHNQNDIRNANSLSSFRATLKTLLLLHTRIRASVLTSIVDLVDIIGAITNLFTLHYRQTDEINLPQKLSWIIDSRITDIETWARSLQSTTGRLSDYHNPRTTRRSDGQSQVQVSPLTPTVAIWVQQ